MRLTKLAHNYSYKAATYLWGFSQPCTLLALVRDFFICSLVLVLVLFQDWTQQRQEYRVSITALFFFNYYYFKLGCSLSVSHTAQNKCSHLFWINFSGWGNRALPQAWPSVLKSDGQAQNTNFNFTLTLAVLVLIYVAEGTHNQWFQEGQEFLAQNKVRKYHDLQFG